LHHAARVFRMCPRAAEVEMKGASQMRKKLVVIPLFVLTVLALIAAATAKDKLGPYTLLTTITVPADQGVPANLAGGFDISWVDSANGMYYLSERTGVAGKGRIDVFDAENDQFLYFIYGFVGNSAAGRDASGPAGVLAIHKEHELWVGDGDSTTKVVSLDATPPAVVATISTGGTMRADELAYDPIDHIIIIANDADTPPFVTFISQQTRSVLGKISYPQATNGLEQSVWDQQSHKFYMSVPATVANPNGEVDEIDPLSMSITRVFPISTTCGPAGLALLPHQRLITSCGVALDARTGGTIATISNVAADEIWYNPGDERVYFGNASMGVVDEATLSLVTKIAVGSTHSVAADSENNHIFVPVTGVGVKVYTDDSDQHGNSGK
jgi:hypothetical protein